MALHIAVPHWLLLRFPMFRFNYVLSIVILTIYIIALSEGIYTAIVNDRSNISILLGLVVVFYTWPAFPSIAFLIYRKDLKSSVVFNSIIFVLNILMLLLITSVLVN